MVKVVFPSYSWKVNVFIISSGLLEKNGARIVLPFSSENEFVKTSLSGSTIFGKQTYPKFPALRKMSAFIEKFRLDVNPNLPHLS